MGTENAHMVVDYGDTRVLEATFENSDGTETNPTTTTLEQLTPAGVRTTSTSFTTPTTGTKRITVGPLTQAGAWRFYITGAGNSVDQQHYYAIDVRRRRVPTS